MPREEKREPHNADSGSLHERVHDRRHGSEPRPDVTESTSVIPAQTPKEQRVPTAVRQRARPCPASTGRSPALLNADDHRQRQAALSRRLASGLLHPLDQRRCFPAAAGKTPIDPRQRAAPCRAACRPRRRSPATVLNKQGRRTASSRALRPVQALFVVYFSTSLVPIESRNFVPCLSTRMRLR